MTPARIALAVALAAATLLAATQLLSPPVGAASAAKTPQQSLESTPLAGTPFATLAKSETDPARKLQIHQIAARRAPRDLGIRAWLFEHHLAAGEPTLAMEHLDVMLRLAPPDVREGLLRAVVQLAADPGFADVVVETIANGAAWRPGLLSTMWSMLDAPGTALIFAGLQERDALTDGEVGTWLNALIQAGRWGQAYSLWASGLDLAPGEPLPMLWNGDFDQDPDGHGFGWRLGMAPGSYTELQLQEGTTGRAARIVFLGRPVARANLEQPLHLPSGGYRLRMRLRGEALRTYQGLRWEVACASGQPRFPGEPIDGSFEWRKYTLEFNVPVTDCAGQWLRLQNPAPAGSAQVVSGELWVDDVSLKQAE